MTSVLDIREEHARILRDVLQKLLPPHARAYVFGSRAHGGARRYSDLDLALEWSGPLGLDRLGAIAEALSESDIPYKMTLSSARPLIRRFGHGSRTTAFRWEQRTREVRWL